MSAPLTAVCSTPRHPSLLALLPSPSHKLQLYPPPASLPLPSAVAPSSTLRAPPSLVPLSHPPSLLAASPDSLAVGYQGLPTVLLWNLARGVQAPVALPAPPLALACSGAALYSLARGEAVLEERPLSTLLLSRQIRFGGRVAEGRGVALSAAVDGSSVAVAGRKDRVKVLDLKDGSKRSADAPTKPAASPKRSANELQQSVRGAGDRGSTAPAQELKRRRAEADAAEEGDDGPTVADLSHGFAPRPGGGPGRGWIPAAFLSLAQNLRDSLP
ncbi:hypothetical protein TeGR_g9129, partial [Tetraparma gracilis]